MKDYFKISRAIWNRGRPNNSYLLRGSDNKMCGVGIYLMHLGVDRSDLLNKPSPLYMPPHKIPPSGKWLINSTSWLESELAQSLMETNDRPDISDGEREEQIKQLFRKQDIEVEFVD